MLNYLTCVHVLLENVSQVSVSLAFKKYLLI